MAWHVRLQASSPGGMYTEMSHTPSTPSVPHLEVSEVPQIHKGHKINLILRNPSVAHEKKSLLSTQSLPGGTGKVINSLSFSKIHLRKGKELPQGSGQQSFLNTVNMQGGKAACHSCPTLSLSRCCLGFKAESLLALERAVFLCHSP